MITFDLVIVSNASTLENKDVTQRCIDSILDTEEDGYKFNPIIVEQNPKVAFEDALTIHYDFDFNYNKCLNEGLKHSSAKYKGLCNNDLVFHYKWFEGVVDSLESGFGSVSPYCVNSHSGRYDIANTCISGYSIGGQMAGWCIFLTDETLSKIGKLNEGVAFWYSDNIYAEQLKYHKIKHGIVCNSFVTHIGSHTLNQVSRLARRSITVEQKKQFEAQRNQIWKGKVVPVYSRNAMNVNGERNVKKAIRVKKEKEHVQPKSSKREVLNKEEKRKRKILTKEERDAIKEQKEYREVTDNIIEVIPINKKEEKNGEEKKSYVRLSRALQARQNG